MEAGPMSAHPDLFPETVPPPDPLQGLAVTLSDHCQCGAFAAIIAEGVGPHTASLRCAKCDVHRGWILHETHRFVTELVQKFGRPTDPIAIRRGRQQP
jgi:hypothetical protein